MAEISLAAGDSSHGASLRQLTIAWFPKVDTLIREHLLASRVRPTFLQTGEELQMTRPMDWGPCGKAMFLGRTDYLKKGITLLPDVVGLLIAVALNIPPDELAWIY